MKTSLFESYYGEIILIYTRQRNKFFIKKGGDKMKIDYVSDLHINHWIPWSKNSLIVTGLMIDSKTDSVTALILSLPKKVTSPQRYNIFF